MKTLIISALAFLFVSLPAMAMEGKPHDHKDMTLKKVENKYVCMVNDMSYERPQIAVEIDGKTYYGCCPMCAGRLQKDTSLRMAKDPVSGKEVDKASAVIGAMSDGMVHYFENEENMKAFNGHADHEGQHDMEDHAGH